jgi:hypothetical protein
MSPALCIRHCVRYSWGVCPKTVLNFKAKAGLDMRASRASDATQYKGAPFILRPLEPILTRNASRKPQVL